MRAVDVRITATGGGFGPFHQGILETSAVTLEALHEIRLLDDGSTVMLYEFSGDQASAERLAEVYLESTVFGWQTQVVEGKQLMYAHAEPSSLAAGLVSMLDEWKFVVDWPILFPTDEELLLTLIGDGAEIRDALANVPDGVRVRVDRTGSYQPELTRLFAQLTPSERAAVRTAVDLGYYRNPREANYSDLAATLDCATSTVGTHLRNAEMKVMQRLVAHRNGTEDRETVVGAFTE